ncbi:CBS domain-containing protein [Blastococcus sp. TML/M2B]|nr:CBS domain-containing protein [Blastococcus sp. TML/M2B]
MTATPVAPASLPRRTGEARERCPGSSPEAPGAGHVVTAADVMIAGPKVVSGDVSVGDVRHVFEDDHVVMVLLAERGFLLGALLRGDLPDTVPASAPALPLSTTSGRTVLPTEPVAAVLRRLRDARARRLAVVDGAGRLLGLVCLKRSRTGFCRDAGVAARSRATSRSRGRQGGADVGSPRNA